MLKNFQQTRFASGLLDVPWLMPLRQQYHHFDDWFLQKAKDQAPLWSGFDVDGKLSALLYTKQSQRVTLSAGAFLAHPHGYLKIGMICTEQARKGWGRFGVLHAIEQARQHQIHAIYATMLPELTAASALFLSCGFCLIGQKTVKGQLHLVVMLQIRDD